VLMIVPSAGAVALTTASRVAGTLAFFVVVLALDVALTFATVVLAFYEITAGRAVRYSIAVTRAQWPTCALYVLLAPLAIHLTLLAIPARTVRVAVMLPLQFLIAVLALAIKGATVLFYADHYLRDGARMPAAPGGEAVIPPEA